jgi:hypothetical protein
MTEWNHINDKLPEIIIKFYMSEPVLLWDARYDSFHVGELCKTTDSFFWRIHDLDDDYSLNAFPYWLRIDKPKIMGTKQT